MADVSGSLAATGANDTATFSGRVNAVGTLNVVGKNDVATISGTVPTAGSLLATGANDVVTIAGYAGASGSLLVTEANDLANLSFVLFHSPGTLAAIEHADLCYFKGELPRPPPSKTQDRYGRPLRQIPYDVHVRRSGDDYATRFISLLPQGQAWPTDPQSILHCVCRGLSDYYGFIDGRAADLLERECDPRFTLELLPDWERAWGLPDPCFPEATTIGERQRMLVLVMTMLGGQSRAWFQWVADWIGFPIYFREWAPFMCGISEVGDTRMEYDDSGYFRWEIGPPEMRFYWSVQPAAASVIWFRASSGQAGVDPHVRVGTAEDLACLFRRWKPAHTDIVFDYSSLAAGGPMQGTP